MAVSATHQFDKDFDTVWAYFTDQAKQTAKFEGLGSRNVEFIACEDQGGTFVVHFKREVPANPPSMLKKFVSEWTPMEEKIEWADDGAGGRKATYSAKTLSGPNVTITGTMHLVNDGGKCANNISLSVDVSVPLVGKKLAAFVEGDTEKMLDAEHAFTSAAL